MKVNSRAGFTILELIIYSAIFTIASISFLAILTSVTRVEVRQGAASEVSSQSQFLLQTIQRYVENSSLIEMPKDISTTTIKLRMARNSNDPTYIYASGTRVYIKETDSGIPQPLSSDKVNASDISFIRRTNPGAKDSLSISFTLGYNTQALQSRFSQTLQTSIARVSAATFDSDIRASSTNTYKIGAAAQEWQSINDTVYFSGSNVGVGVASPAQTLELNGGIRLNTTNGQPGCSSAQRGTFWVAQGGAGVKDDVQVCVKNASDTYAWSVIY